MGGYLKKGRKRLLVFLAVCLVPLLVWGHIPAEAAEDEVQKLKIEIGAADGFGKYLPQAEECEPIMAYSMESSGWAYGSQLNENQEQIYNTLANTNNMLAVNSQNMIVVKIQEPYWAFSSLAYETAMKDIARAVHAFMKDYNEYYWMESFDGWIQSGKDDPTMYSQVWLVPMDYYSGVRSEIGAADAELQKAINTVKAKQGTYEKVLAAHDYVAGLVEYNAGDLYGKYGHTITGGLLPKYNHKAVCECYAKLFKLICNANGIPCILISGGSERDSQGNVKLDHMWNYVQMDDGLWYLVDVTWDDWGAEYGNYIDYDYFLAGAQTGVYWEDKLITVQQNHIPVGRFNTVSYQPFVVPVLATRSYEETYGIESPVQSFSLKETAFSLDPEQGKYISIGTHAPTDKDYNMVFTYSSSNPAVATVNANGFVKAKSVGKTTITVSARNNPSVKATCTVTVTDHVFDAGVLIKAPTTSSTGKLLYTCKHGCGKTQEKAVPKAYVKLNAATLPLKVKQSTSALRVTGIGSQDKVAKWSSSNKKVAAVNSMTGKITAKKTGTATITVKTAFGAKASCKVKVQKSVVKTKKLTLPKTAITLKKGKTYTIKAVRSPLTATDALKYTTSNKKVATVSARGKVTAKKKGRATITVKSASGKKAKLTVKVS